MNRNIYIGIVVFLFLLVAMWIWQKNRSSEFASLVQSIRDEQKNTTGNIAETDKGK